METRPTCSISPARWSRLLLVGMAFGLCSLIADAAVAPRNIVFILSDDHRYDAMGFMGHPFVETPHLDSLARNGAHFPNAFVTTALCSPSRASILTGLYAHRHGVVDNNNPVRADLVFFPQLLQTAGYKTGFFGKWHMGGDSDAPQRGFDRWVSFRGQGKYWPDNRGGETPKSGQAVLLNVDGREIPQRGYITDELTDYALEWMKTVPKDRPFFLYLSHKAVHGPSLPAERHAGRYKDRPVPVPASRTHHEHRISAIRGTGSIFPSTSSSTSTRTTAAIASACSRSMTASAACSRPCASAGSSTTRSSSTWATTAMGSANTG